MGAITGLERRYARAICMHLDALGGGGGNSGQPTRAQIEAWLLRLQDITDTANGKGASLIAVEDAGGLTATTDVEAYLAENRAAIDVAEAAIDVLEAHVNTAQAVVDIPLRAWTEEDLTELVVFADGASTLPGFVLDGTEARGIRWNDHATPDPLWASVLLPYDVDGAAAVVLEVLAHKTGATLADAVTWTVTAFVNADGLLYDADADMGGASSAMTGDATSKTSQLEALSFGAGDIPDAGPMMITLSIQPTDGTLGSDDVTITGTWLKYTRKTLS